MSSVDIMVYKFLINNKGIILPMTTEMVNYQYNTNELLAAEMLTNLQFASSKMIKKPFHEYISDSSLVTGSTSILSPITPFYIPFSAYHTYHGKIEELSESSYGSTWSKKQSDNSKKCEDENENDEEEYDDKGDYDTSDDDKEEENSKEESIEEYDNKNIKKGKKYNRERYRRHSKGLRSITVSSYSTSVIRSDHQNSITKPRWSNKERFKLLIAVIKEKQLENLSTFRWKEISKQLQSKRSSRACQYQWKYELLPKLKIAYE